MSYRNDKFVVCADARKLFRNKFAVFIGDSVVRGMYKDIVTLINEDGLLRPKDLKDKGELSFRGDELLEGGVMLKEGLNNGIDYREVRQFKSDFYLVRFYFVTCCYGKYIESILDDFEEFPPDIMIMNSALWDITRYGARSVEIFEKNLVTLMNRMQAVLPAHSLFIWLTSLFVSSDMRGGFMIPTIEHKKASIRLDIVQANWYVAIKCNERRLDLFDINFVMRKWQETEMVKDGVHWNERGHRIISTFLMSYIAQSLNINISDNFLQLGVFPDVVGRGFGHTVQHN